MVVVKLLLAAALLLFPSVASAEIPAIAKAEKLCQAEKAKVPEDQWAKGPCISDGKDIPGWAVDIAHMPRLPVDEDPKNQCDRFRKGVLEHFIELDQECNLIRAK